METEGQGDSRRGSRWALLAVAVTLLFVACVRLRLAGVPLERDEGEYAYAGRLILQGIPPYELAYNMKFPGTYYAYAAILAAFGNTPWGIHVGLLVVNLATVVLVFAITRRLFGALAGSAAAIAYALLSLDRAVLGVFAHATHFVVLAALAGLYLLLRAEKRPRTRTYLASGVLFGVAVLMKQHAAAFVPAAAWLASSGLGRREALRRAGAVAVGAFVPLAVILVALAAQGVLGAFWFWTFRYAAAYVNEVPFAGASRNLTEGLVAVTAHAWGLWLLAALGVAALWRKQWEPPARAVVIGLLATSALALCPGFYFRNHYFILILPALAMLVGAAVASMQRRASHAVAAIVLVAAAGQYVVSERGYLFTMTPRELIRATYKRLPFIEALEIGSYIREHTGPDDRVAVFGSEPEIYFYAGRKAATGYIYTYPLIEPQPFAPMMQAEMIREIEAAHPRYFVFSKIEGSWSMRRSSDQGIIRWGFDYVRECYDPVGVVDIVSDDTTRILWGDEVLTYKPSSPDVVYTFVRKSDSPCTAQKGDTPIN